MKPTIQENMFNIFYIFRTTDENLWEYRIFLNLPDWTTEGRTLKQANIKALWRWGEPLEVSPHLGGSIYQRQGFLVLQLNIL